MNITYRVQAHSGSLAESVSSDWQLSQSNGDGLERNIQRVGGEKLSWVCKGRQSPEITSGDQHVVGRDREQ